MNEVRCWVYRELGALFDALPETLVPPAGDAGPYPRTREAILALCRDFASSVREQVEAEQVRLFVNAAGGVPAPPYASWFLDGRLLGPSCEWAAAEYGAQSLDLAASAGEPADFVGVELEYMYFLCRHERAARATGDATALEAATRAQERFFRQHLARWLPRFAADIRAATPDGVFRRVADVLAAFCDEELGRWTRAASLPS